MLIIIGLIGLVILIAGIVLVVWGFAKENLGFKIGGLFAMLKGGLILFLILLNVFIIYATDV